MKVLVSKREVILDDDCEKHIPHLATSPARGTPVVLWYELNLVGNRVGYAVSYAQKLMKADVRKGEYVIHKNGNTLDVSRGNLQVVGRDYFNRWRRTTTWKGVSKKGGRWKVNVYLNNRDKISLSLPGDEPVENAARLYDAICNFLGIDGYRNFSKEKSVLPEGYRERIRRRYEEIIKK